MPKSKKKERKGKLGEIDRQQAANRLIHARRGGVKLSKEEKGKVSSAFNRAMKRRTSGYR